MFSVYFIIFQSLKFTDFFSIRRLTLSYDKQVIHLIFTFVICVPVQFLKVLIDGCGIKFFKYITGLDKDETGKSRVEKATIYFK